MADAPEKIWLQRPCRDPENEWFGEVTLCDSRENSDDTEYVRTDIAMAEIDRRGMLLKDFEAVTRQLKTALIRHRARLFPGTDQKAVIDRDFPTPNASYTANPQGLQTADPADSTDESIR